MDIGEKIITKAGDLFMQYGIKSISMDEVARNLGISKKTLYQHVDNKADLIQKVMMTHITAEKHAMCVIHEAANDAIDEMILSQFPVILGKGIPLFPNGPKETKFKLTKLLSFHNHLTA